MTNATDPVIPHLTYNQTSGNPNGFMEGLTKREYFAAMAMQGLLASFTEKAALGAWGEELKEIAEVSTEMADQLINALNK